MDTNKELTREELLENEVKDLKESKEFWMKESNKWETKFKNLKQAISSIVVIVD